jgi:hypothetical protein
MFDTEADACERVGSPEFQLMLWDFIANARTAEPGPDDFLLAVSLARLWETAFADTVQAILKVDEATAIRRVRQLVAERRALYGSLAAGQP